MAVRRLHDSDRSSWWFLVLMLPLVGLVWFIVLMSRPGDAGPNRFGDVPAAQP